MPTEIQTPPGRIVWGNPGKSQIKKIQEGPTKGQPVLKDNQPVTVWAFGIAIPKDQFGPVWAAMSAEAATGFPNGVPGKFAWKYTDGDGVDQNGAPYRNREGYAGCYIINISTEAFAPPIYRWTGAGYVQMQPNEIKTGDYVSVALNLKVNVSTNPARSSSLYVNPVAINFIGYGNEIVNGPDPMALFKGAQHQLPPGASATPMAPAHAAQMPGTNTPPQGGPQHQAPPNYPPPGQPQYQAPPQMQPPPNYSAPPAHVPPGPPSYPPAHDFVHNAGQPQMPPGAPQYAPPPNYPPPGQPQQYPPQGGPGNPQYQQPPGNPYPQR